jgi:hypothetical protein
MSFIIQCEKCEKKVRLQESSNPNPFQDVIFTHANGISCECGNKVPNNLTKEAYTQIKQYDRKTEDYILQLNNLIPNLSGVEAVWAYGCLSKVFGIIDASLTVLELLPLAKKHPSEGYTPLAAMSKASYSYVNVLSLYHDLLDNIAFMYDAKVLETDIEKVKKHSKSFFFLFDKNSGRLKVEKSKSGKKPSTNESINSAFVEIYQKTSELIDRDNDNKHRYSSGLIHLHQPEKFIRDMGSIAGNTIDFLDLGAVSIEKATRDIQVIRNETLYLTLICVAQLIIYDKDEVV